MNFHGPNFARRSPPENAAAENIFASRRLNLSRHFAGIFLLATTVMALAQNPTVEIDHPFRFGFSTDLLRDVNQNDSQAAMKVWTEALLKEGAVQTDTNSLLFNNPEMMLAALRNGALDGVAVTTREFLALQEQVKFNRYIFGTTDGSIYEEYVLLVHVRSGINQIEDLRGRSLNLFEHARMSLAVPWLDTRLMEKGLPPTRDFCGKVVAETKLTKALLPVFFRQADACLVTRKGFKTMSELNPQVGQQLRVLAASPEFVPGGFFFLATYPKPQQDKFVAEVSRIHKTAAGQQILTVFQMDRLEEYPAAVLDSANTLMKDYRRLCGATNPIQGGVASTGHDATRGAVK